MTAAQELYGFPASKLDAFVARWLQPTREWKEEVLETVQTVERFLRQENFRGERGLVRDAQVLKVFKVRLALSIAARTGQDPVLGCSAVPGVTRPPDPCFMPLTSQGNPASCLQT